MTERTELEREVESVIVDKTRSMLDYIFDFAAEHKATEAEVKAAIDRFGGGDLVDVWINDYSDEWDAEVGR